MKNNLSAIDAKLLEIGFEADSSAIVNCQSLVDFYRNDSLKSGKLFVGVKSYKISGEQIKIMENMLNSLISSGYNPSGWLSIEAGKPTNIYIYYKFKERGVDNYSGLFPLEYQDYLDLRLMPVNGNLLSACLITTGVK